MIYVELGMPSPPSRISYPGSCPLLIPSRLAASRQGAATQSKAATAVQLEQKPLLGNPSNQQATNRQLVVQCGGVPWHLRSTRAALERAEEAWVVMVVPIWCPFPARPACLSHFPNLDGTLGVLPHPPLTSLLLGSAFTFRALT